MANDAMRAHWESAGGPAWVRNQEVFDRALVDFGDAVVAALGPQRGERVLDVGCGYGTTSVAVAEAGATVTGVDISPPMIEAARARLPAGTFTVADAQTDHLGGPFDAVVSRFGVMFFDDPAAAFANIRASVVPGGRLTFVCWRGLSENPMFTAGSSVIMAEVPRSAAPDPHAPGPVAFADPDRVRQILADARWSDVVVTALDGVCRFDTDTSDGIDERLAMILAGETGRLMTAHIPDAEQPALLERVRADLRERRVDGKLHLPGAVWLVSARC